MPLFYRGTAYEPQSSALEVTETNQLGLFLGNRFKIKQVNVAQRYPMNTSLRYRGVDYQQ